MENVYKSRLPILVSLSNPSDNSMSKLNINAKVFTPSTSFSKLELNLLNDTDKIMKLLYNNIPISEWSPELIWGSEIQEIIKNMTESDKVRFKDIIIIINQNKELELKCINLDVELETVYRSIH